MFTLLAAVLAALSGLTYWLTQGTWGMPYWLAVISVIGSTAVAEVLEGLLQRRRLRAGRARRAHARTTTPRRTP